MYKLFCTKKIDAENFTSSDTILNVLCNVFRNVDGDLIKDTEFLQDSGLLEQKSRKYYNYALCSTTKLSNLRRLDSKTLSTELDTLENFNIFHSSIFYHGKATGRRDLMHLSDTIIAIIGWQAKIVKAGGKIDTCMKALLESKGVIIVSAFQDSSHYLAHNREYSMIEYTGLDKLTNVYRGSRFGSFTLSNEAEVYNYGMLCTYILFRNYINNGASPFTFEDLVFQKQLHLRKLDLNDNKCDHKCVNCSMTLKCTSDTF